MPSKRKFVSKITCKDFDPNDCLSKIKCKKKDLCKNYKKEKCEIVIKNDEEVPF